MPITSMDVLDEGHQQSGETHRDGGGMEGWRALSRKKEKKKHCIKVYSGAAARDRVAGREWRRRYG